MLSYAFYGLQRLLVSKVFGKRREPKKTNGEWRE